MKRGDNLATRGNSDTTAKIKNFTPRWNRAINGEDKAWYVVEVPLSFDKTPGFVIKTQSENEQKNINGRTSLLILKNKRNGEIQSALMHIASNDITKDTTLTYFNRSEDFGGNIFFTDINGLFINGWLYEKGKIVAKSKGTASNQQSAREFLNECQVVGTDWYERTCYYYDDNSVECTNWEYVGTTYQTYCSDGGGSGGGGGYQGDNDDNVDKITDSLTNQILDCARQKIEDWSAYNGFINTVVSYFHVVNDYNVVLKEFNDPNNSLPMARTSRDIYDDHKINIALNINKLQGASQELVIEVIFHEFIHAFFLTYDPGDLPESEHYTMLTSYLDEIVNATQTLCPSLPDRDAYALALYGVSDILRFTGDTDYINAWNTKATEQNLNSSQIDAILSAYKNKIKGTVCQ